MRGTVAARAARQPLIETRRSAVHGQGVFALVTFAPGETIVEYVGEIIDLQEALRHHPHDPNDPHHTFYFHIDDRRVIDGLHGGNESRWINHSCQPNCEPDEVKARRPIFPGEELSFDYGLVSDEPLTEELKAAYPSAGAVPQNAGARCWPPV